jgi:hypothetical protein
VSSGARDSSVEEGTENGGGNGGVVDGKRSGTDGASSDGGWGGRHDSGEGGGSTKEVGRSEAGTVEGFPFISEDALTPLLAIRLRRGPEVSRFADTDDLMVLKGDLWFSFPLDLERVLRGERREGPGTGAGAGAGAGAPFVSKGADAADGSAFFVVCSLSLGFQNNEQRHYIKARGNCDDLHGTPFQSVLDWGCLVHCRAEVPKLGRFPPHQSEEGERQNRPAPHIVWCFVERASSPSLLSLRARMNIPYFFEVRSTAHLARHGVPL